ncbi:hypothetical protein ADJ73_03725 [Arsenicicoccus sp. oral taxon 190]|nr:hypothetical protein ADJ73_03725 [Arsenicicoccus sp. oral taxon 190]
MRGGETVAIRFSKWDASPHWAYDGCYLGADEFGHWVRVPVGARIARPGQAFDNEHESVVCLPVETGHVITTNAAPHKIRHYVDVTTAPMWRRVEGVATVAMVDLDLDVVERRTGRTYIDDEDEFADHQVLFGYPPELVTAAEARAHRMLRLVESGAEPFATVAEEWLRRAVAGA